MLTWCGMLTCSGSIWTFSTDWISHQDYCIHSLSCLSYILNHKDDVEDSALVNSWKSTENLWVFQLIFSPLRSEYHLWRRLCPEKKEILMEDGLPFLFFSLRL